MTLSRLFFPLVSLIIGAFIAGPGFGLAGAMVVWYVITYRDKLFSNTNSLRTLSQVTLGAIATIVVVGLEIGLISILGLLTTSMGK